jgi:hypothetical protein
MMNFTDGLISLMCTIIMKDCTHGQSGREITLKTEKKQPNLVAILLRNQESNSLATDVDTEVVTTKHSWILQEKRSLRHL